MHHSRLLAPLALVLIFFSLLPGNASTVQANALPDETQPRPAIAATPSISLNAPSAVAIGEDFTFTVTFDNTGSDPGYGPFIDIYFPVNGADGAGGTATPDGIDFDSAQGVTYLGQKLTVHELTFNSSGQVTHPLARDTSGNYIKVTGTPGDKLVVVELPFGSFVPSQPAITVTVHATLSDLADAGTALTLRARGGFRFGATPIDDWCCDPVILNPSSNTAPSWPGGNVTPTVFTLSKSLAAPESETATGPNYPRTFTITADIADGQTLTNFTITDNLPDNLVFKSIISASPAGYTVVSSPPTTGPQNPPNNQLKVQWASVTGGPGSSDVTITYQVYVPRLDANSNAVLNPTTGASNTSVNSAAAQGDWQPKDTRDTSTTVTHGSGPIGVTLTDKSLPVQKSVSVVGGGDVKPGAKLEYTLQVQVSDFFAFDNVVLSDVISDGQHFDSSFTPTITVNGNGYTISGQNFHHSAPDQNYTVSCNYTGGPGAECDVDDPAANDGTTKITFRISDEIIDQGQANGRLVGGCINPSTGSNPPVCNSYNNGPTTVTVTFRTEVQDAFTDNYADRSVDQGDTLDDNVTVTGEVLDTDTFASTGNTPSDTSSASASVARGNLTKSVYAINGSTAITSPYHIQPGDTVTYRIKYTLPTSDVEDLYFVDYLPLPVLDVDDPDADGTTGPAWVFDDTQSATAPTAGHAHFGPDDTFRAYSGIVPTLAKDSAANSLTFTYGNFDNPANASKVVDILFTVTVNNQPFADQLHLTNQARAHEGSTNASDQTADSIVEVILDEPLLVHKKSVIASDNPNATISPALSGYTFTAPGSSGKRWTSPAVISSSYLSSHPLDSNINSIDGGDLVSFAIVIENQGSSTKGAFDITIKDVLPAGYQMPAGGYNLEIRYGDGNGPIDYTKPDGSPATAADLFAGGIRLVDPGNGVCAAHDPNLGNNVIILTYDLQVVPTIGPNATLTNEGQLLHYSNREGGDNFVGSTPLKDTAKATVSDPASSKSITATSDTETIGSNLHVGEKVTFQITATLPEGESDPVTIVDNLPHPPDGVLEVVSHCVVSVGANLTLTNSPTGLCPTSFGTAADAAGGDGINDRVTFDFGKVTNTADGVENEKDKITVQVVAVVRDHTNVHNGTVLTNTATVTAGGGSSSSTADVTILKPDLSITKSDNSDFFSAGSLLIYKMDYQNSGGYKATGVYLQDTIPANTTFDADNSTAGWVIAGTSTPCQNGTPAGTVCRYNLGTVNAGASGSVNFAVRTDAGYTAATLANTVTIQDDGSAGADSDISNNTATDTDLRSTLGKSVQATNQTFTTGNNVAIGEIVTYRLVWTVPHGSTATVIPNVSISDTLDEGLAFLDCVSVTASSSDLTTDLAGGFAAACNPNSSNPSAGNPAIYPVPRTGAGSSNAVNQGREIVFNLGTVTNNSTISDQTLTIDYRVVVLDSAANVRGTSVNNSATLNWDGSKQGGLTVQATNVTVVEPGMYITKSADTSVAFPGTTITFRITIGHLDTSNATAYDVVMSDPLSKFLQYVPGSLQVVDGLAADTLDDSDPTSLRVVWNEFPRGITSTVQFQAVLQPGSSQVSNVASVAWSSLPGDVSAPQSSFNTLSTERYYDPGDPVNIYRTSAEFVIIVPGRHLPGTGFPPGEETTLLPGAGMHPIPLREAIHLDIPALGVSIPVVGVPFDGAGWDLTWLGEQAGWLEGTAYPTWPGNTALTAHAYLPSGLPGPFAGLERLKWGDLILLRTATAEYIYQVRERYETTPDDLTPLYGEKYDWLTLITCRQYDEKLGDYRWRTIVRAVLIAVR